MLKSCKMIYRYWSYGRKSGKCLSMLTNVWLYLYITLKRNPIYSSYHLHGEQLTVVQCAKYLGVSIDSKLSFNQHVDNVCKKENSVLSFVRRNFANCSCKIKESTYIAVSYLRQAHNGICSCSMGSLQQTVKKQT